MFGALGSIITGHFQRKCECEMQKAMHEIRRQHDQAMTEFYLRRDDLHKKMKACGGPNWHMRHVPLIHNDRT